MIPSDPAFRRAIHEALAACLALAPDSDDALSLIREAYTEPENSPQPSRQTDVIYWSVTPEMTYAPRPPALTAGDARGGAHAPRVHHFLPVTLLVVCYGPGCEANVHRIRSFLYLDGKDFPRAILRKAGIYPVPDPPEPLLLYEEEGSLWRRRADLSVSLRVTDISAHEKRRGAVQSVPAVMLKKSR